MQLMLTLNVSRNKTRFLKIIYSCSQGRIYKFCPTPNREVHGPPKTHKSLHIYYLFVYLTVTVKPPECVSRP